jgi:hypothetical protein
MAAAAAAAAAAVGGGRKFRFGQQQKLDVGGGRAFRGGFLNHVLVLFCKVGRTEELVVVRQTVFFGCVWL